MSDGQYIEYPVTAIRDINSKRRLVEINNEPVFALYNSEIRKYGIKKDINIPNDVYQEIITEVLSKRAIVRTMHLLESRDYTQYELEKKLKDAYYPDICIQQAVDYVSRFGYLNDKRYVENYITFQAPNKSKMQIMQFLGRKGIDKATVEAVYEEYYEMHGDTEVDQLVVQMRKKAGKYNLSEYADKTKLMGYFYRKGYQSDNIKKALDIIVNERYNTSFS